MEKCKKIQLATITLSPDEFKAHPEYVKHIGSCEACSEFIEDLKNIRSAAKPSWFLEHMPKTFWSDFAEEIKAFSYGLAFKSRLRFLKPPFYLALGGMVTLAILLFPPTPKENVLRRFSWERHFKSLNQLTDYHDPQPLPRIATDNLSQTLLSSYADYLKSENPLTGIKLGEHHATRKDR